MELKILEHSEFGEIRTLVDEKGNILFCGSDVAAALGYSNQRDAVLRHCKGVVKHDTLTDGGIQTLSFITEPNLYRLVMKSKLPTAIEFERWVFEDVLPSLRKYGFFASDEVLNDPDLLSAMVEKLQQEQAEKIVLAMENERLSENIAYTKPHLDYLQTILNSDCTMTSTQIAADYGISATKLNRILHKVRVHHKVGNQWILYCNYMNRGLTQSETVAIAYYGFVVRTKWTQRGRLIIHEIFSDLGITACSDNLFKESEYGI